MAGPLKLAGGIRRLKYRAVADSLEETGERLFTFTRLPPRQWRSMRTTNAIELVHEEFKRRTKTQTVLSSSDTVMLFWCAGCLRTDQHAQGRWVAEACDTDQTNKR
jgi:transposase-like protein